MEFRMTLAHARTIVLVCLSLNLGAASAATVVQEIQNEFKSNAMYLWSDDPGHATIETVLLGQSMRGWGVQTETSTMLVLSGPVLAPGAGRFLLRLAYDAAPISLQWAEVFFDSGVASLRGAGSLRFEDRTWTAVDVFTRGNEIPGLAAAPVPLPHALGLLLAPLLLASRRRESQQPG
jgi:hypothetical protein